MPNQRLLFVLDVDNTLVDNDRVKQDLEHDTEALFGAERSVRFWELYEEVRHERDFVDFPHTLERFGQELPGSAEYARLCGMVLGYDFEQALYPGAIQTIRYLRSLGDTIIVSDGDPVFQPAKIGRAGLAEAIRGPVLIYEHKEQHLHEIEQRFPGKHHVMVDDKPRLLAAAKEVLGDGVTTVLVRQGHYAREHTPPDLAPPDLAVDAIADLQKVSADRFARATGRGSAGA